MWSWKCWLSKVCPKLNGFFEKLMIIFFVLLVHLAINSNIIWSSLFYGLVMHWAKRCFIFQNHIFFNKKEWYEISGLSVINSFRHFVLISHPFYCLPKFIMFGFSILESMEMNGNIGRKWAIIDCHYLTCYK